MEKKILNVAVLGAAACILTANLLSIPVSGATIKGKCIDVSEGDKISVTLLGKVLRVRLDGIDCPEMAQAFGAEAKTFTSSMILEKRVTVEIKSYESDTLLIGRVFVEDRDLSLELVNAGLAWYYKEHGSDKKLAKAQKKAKKNKVGLWSQPGPAPPWVFRQIEGKKQKSGE